MSVVKPPKMNNYGLFKRFFFFLFCGNLFSIPYIIRNTSSVYNGTKAWRINREYLVNDSSSHVYETSSKNHAFVVLFFLYSNNSLALRRIIIAIIYTRY